MGSPRVAPSNRLRRVDDRFKPFRANKAACATGQVRHTAQIQPLPGFPRDGGFSRVRNRSPGFEDAVGWPLEGSPDAPPSQIVRGMQAPKHIPPERVKKGERERMGETDRPRPGVWPAEAWRGAGGRGRGQTCAPRHSSGAPTGTVAPAQRARVVKQPGFPGALPVLHRPVQEK